MENIEYKTIDERVSTLASGELAVIITIGVECFLRGLFVSTMGHESLRGHISYMDSDSTALVDAILLTLDQDSEAYYNLQHFMTSELGMVLSQKLHPIMSSELGVE